MDERIRASVGVFWTIGWIATVVAFLLLLYTDAE